MNRLAVAAALLAIASPAAADSLQDQVLAAIRATRTADLAFTTTTRVERTGAAARVIVARYDPRGGWTLVSVDGRMPTEKERRDAAKQKRPVPGYARLAEWFGSPAVRVAQSATAVTYRFGRLPANSLKVGNRDISAGATAEAVVDLSHGTPRVSRVRITSTQGFRMMLVAKVDRMTAVTDYAPLADGRMFPTANSVDMAGSLLGKAGTLTTRTRYSDVHPAR